MNALGLYEFVYEGIPRWDIDFPQPEIVNLERSGLIKGPVLDMGCGTGENSIYLAKKGLEVIGIDVASNAIEKARKKATQYKIDVRFLVDDALNLSETYSGVNTVLDSCLFHCLSTEELSNYAATLKEVLPKGGDLFILCFSEFEPNSWGPRRVKKSEIIHTFQGSWEINFIRKAEIECRVYIRIKDDKGRDPNPPTKKIIGWLSHISNLG